MLTLSLFAPKPNCSDSTPLQAHSPAAGSADHLTLYWAAGAHIGATGTATSKPLDPVAIQSVLSIALRMIASPLVTEQYVERPAIRTTASISASRETSLTLGAHDAGAVRASPTLASRTPIRAK